ncbi:hypothetical protein [Cupriavidus gilardii]|uniref:hypothetical protein n=1 Tax=Cupriavidus gilardii TaxID=82541 RepID=UPI0021B3882A|nr:hypothetical protein [Cupriavidus gilardii]UXC34782.1 hypothetical protein N4G38_10045 [Cupriavidus gilardii]UXC37350.1 hypothetical protein N4G38_07910 [Cupriavidus gilardii]
MADTSTLHGLDDVLRKLQSLPPEIVSKRGGPVKSGLRKGATVVRDEWRAQVQRIIDAPNKDEIPSKSTGLLQKSIIATRNPRPQQLGANEAYRVRIKSATYPATFGKNVTAYGVGRMLEVGTERRAPMPWAVPGFMASREQALNTVVTEINRAIQRVIRKMEKAR